MLYLEANLDEPRHTYEHLQWSKYQYMSQVGCSLAKRMDIEGIKISDISKRGTIYTL